jgi:hypothetical protein
VAGHANDCTTGEMSLLFAGTTSTPGGGSGLGLCTRKNFGLESALSVPGCINLLSHSVHQASIARDQLLAAGGTSKLADQVIDHRILDAGTLTVYRT